MEVDHRCRADRRCIASSLEGGAFTVRANTLCHGCIQRLHDEFSQLPDIRLALRLFLGGVGSAAVQSKVSSTPTRSSPLNVHVLDVIDEVDEIIADIGGTQIADLIRQEDGVDRALRIENVWRKADTIIGLSRAWQQRLAKCPKCNLRTLGSFSGSDSVQCSNCGGVMSRSEYERICLIQARRL